MPEWFSRRGAPLATLDISDCKNIALESLRGFPLTDLCLDGCGEALAEGLGPLHGMPLTDLSLEDAFGLSDAGMQGLRGVPLTSLTLRVCELVTDSGIGAFPEENDHFCLPPLPIESMSLICIHDVC